MITTALTQANLEIGKGTHTNVSDIKDILQAQELQNVLQWISPLDFQMVQESAQKQPVKGTCRWFLESPSFTALANGLTPMLWCHGIPGAGKTLLASSAFERLKGTCTAEQSKSVVMVAFCTFNNEQTHSAIGILSALLRQLVFSRQELSNKIQAMYKEHMSGQKRLRPSLEQVCDALNAELARLDSSFIILDGLDEMPEHQERALLLQKLELLQPRPMLMVTSRPLPTIRSWFAEETSTFDFRLQDEDIYNQDEEENSDWVCDECLDQAKETKTSYWCESCSRDFCVVCYKILESCTRCGNKKDGFGCHLPRIFAITAQPQDLEAYINLRIDESPTLRGIVERTKIRDIRTAIVQKVRQEAGDIFLLAKFQMDVLTQQPSADTVLKALTRLPDQLNRVYDSIFERIDHGLYSKLLRSFIAMISASKTVLTVGAWGHAIAIDAGVETSDDLQLRAMDVNHLAELSLGLVEIDSLGYVRLAYETVRDFVNNSTHDVFKQGDKLLALASLRYLTLVSNVYGVHNGPNKYAELEAMLDAYPLATYAALFWASHARASWDQELQDSSLAFLRDTTCSRVQSQIMFHAEPSWDAEDGINGLHLAAHGGLHSVITRLLADRTDIDDTDCLGTTALMFAAGGGHCASVEVLLHSGADASAVCQRGRTAAILACLHDHPEVVTHLVKSGRDISINACETVSNRSALITAVWNGNLTIVKELLACPDLDVNMSSNDDGRNNALHHATFCGYTEIVHVLLAHPHISINALSSCNKTALIAAASSGQSAILNLLLDQGAELDLKDHLGGPAILRAVDSGHLDCVQILQARGADCSFVDTLGRNILHGCTINDRHAILRYLLQTLQSLDPNSQDDLGKTPLHDAAGRDYDRCVRVLLDFGARTDVLDNQGTSPVRFARDYLKTRCLPLLQLARNTEAEKAGRYQHVSPTRVDTFGPNYKMPIHTAIGTLDQEALQQYLDTIGPEADTLIASRNTEVAETPLHTAAAYGKLYAVIWLLDRGAEIDAQDLWGRTTLLRAAENGREDVVKLLLDHEASLDVPDKFQNTALSTANGENFEVASMLVKKGATFGQRAGALHELLDLVCEHGDLDLAKCLVERGVSFQTKSAGDALTPYRRAQLAGQKDVADYLFAKTEESRKSRPSKAKASHDRVSRPERPSNLAAHSDDAVAVAPSDDTISVVPSDDAVSGAPSDVLLPDQNSVASVVGNEVPDTHQPDQIATPVAILATTMDLARAVLTDVSTRERYLVAVVIVLLALLVAR